MGNTFSTDLDSQTVETSPKTSSASPDPEGKSPRKSKSFSKPGQVQDATRSVAQKPTATEGALSLLQSVFDQALEVGLKAKAYQINQVLILELHGVTLCPACLMWTTMKTCSNCGTTGLTE